MQVPFFELSRQYTDIAEEIKEKVCEIMESCQYIEGPAVKNLEKELEKYLGAKHVITCGNGTDALRIALQANGVKPGDEVITTAFSFFATAEAIAQLGAIPVFADIDKASFNIAVDDVKRKISKKTKAILPVHIFGRPADMDKINEMAVEHELIVIEDACQAMGAQYKDKKTGVLGAAGCFSFYPTKNLGALGDGGMISTCDDEIAEICRAIKSHAAGRCGAKAYSRLYHESVSELSEINIVENGLYDPCKYYNYFIGSNSRLDSVQAAALLVKLQYLDKYNQKRKRIAEIYSRELKELPIRLPVNDTKDNQSCWHQYVILSDQKNELIQYLEKEGIGVGSFYPVPLHLQKAFTLLGYQEGTLPIAEEVCKQSVCLPIFPELREDEIAYVIEIIKKFFE